MVWKTITNRIVGILKRLLSKSKETEIEEVTRDEVETYLSEIIKDLNMRLVLDDAIDEERVLWVESITMTTYRANKKERR